MVSSTEAPRSRKRPDERREEILAASSSIALDDGLESITLRAVADRLGVRPGLITHYFPIAQDLVIAAFTRAVTAEREQLIPPDGSPLERMARMSSAAQNQESRPLARLWLNARHLSRFTPPLAQALEEQEALGRARLLRLIEAGVLNGDFSTTDPFGACVRILIAIDGVGAYVNDNGTFGAEAYTHFVA
ncbi:MAG: TetR/AcrR family transcriptional regulator, partial [Janthinobacterium lividum]